MGATSFIATFLLLAATALLVVASISAPVVNSLYFLSVKSSSYTYHFGVWGYCQTTGRDECTKELGYNLATLLSYLTGGSVSVPSNLDSLTKALVLHPIGAGISAIALLIAAGSNKAGFFCAAIGAALAFIVSAVVMAIDFAIFAIARNKAIDAGLEATFGIAIWCVTAAGRVGPRRRLYPRPVLLRTEQVRARAPWIQGVRRSRPVDPRRKA